MSAPHGAAGMPPAHPGQAAAAPGSPPGPVPRREAVRVALHSVGCKLNGCEMEALASSLQRRGFEVVEFGAPADVCIVNTCTVTAAGEADSRRAVRRARRSSPGGTVLATGCCAQRQPEALYDAGASLVVGNADKAGIAELLAASGSSGPPGPGAGGPLPTGVPACRPVVTRFLQIEGPVPGGRTRGMLQVQDGCDEHCSYCVVPQVRGPSVSRSPAEVIAQAEQVGAMMATQDSAVLQRLQELVDQGDEVVAVITSPPACSSLRVLLCQLARSLSSLPETLPPVEAPDATVRRRRPRSSAAARETTVAPAGSDASAPSRAATAPWCSGRATASAGRRFHLTLSL